jgi:hypothetical protein
MRSLVSGVVGALAALVLVTAWHGGTSADERAAGAMDARLAAVQGDPGAAPVNVQCAPGQRAVVRQLQTGAGHASFIECVAQAEQDLVVMNGANAFVPATYQTAGVAPRVVPAVTTAAAPERVVYRTVERKPSSSRTWKKTAMVIGGSAGAGAGVGALAGGKKGALIGAAIGGGAATLYEAAKRR